MQGAATLPVDVLIVGSTTVDIVVSVPSGMPRLGGDEFTAANLARLRRPPDLRLGGNGAAAAAVLGGLGEPVVLVTNLAGDRWGRWARRRLEARNVRLLVPSAFPHTSVHVVATDSTGRRLSFFYPGSVAVPRELPTCRWCLLAGCPHPEVSELREMASAVGGTTLLDIGPDLGQGFTLDTLAAVLPHVDWLVGNEQEMAACASRDAGLAAAAAAKRLRGGVVLKRGAAGASIFFSGTRPSLHAGAFRVEPVSTIGAGDAFDAALLYGLSRGWPWARTLRFANAVAAWTVQSQDGVLGTAAASEVEAWMAQRWPADDADPPVPREAPESPRRDSGASG